MFFHVLGVFTVAAATNIVVAEFGLVPPDFSLATLFLVCYYGVKLGCDHG
jgi:hypothetical protein